jgi:hypothetical protein
MVVGDSVVRAKLTSFSPTASDVTSTAFQDLALSGPDATKGGAASGALTNLILFSFQRL